MPTFDEFYFISSTGANRIHVKTCTPDGEVRGVVQIAHGIAEHAERYADFRSRRKTTKAFLPKRTAGGALSTISRRSTTR